MSANTAGSRPIDRVVVTCALTGALANRKQCSVLPYTPSEIADEARRAYEAGASVVHIHARNPDGTPTFEPKVFAEIAREIQARCPVLLNFSTGSLDPSIALQSETLTTTRPSIAALNMGTMNYGKYSKTQRKFVFDMVFPNPFSKIQALLEVMNQAQICPELECFDIGHTASAGTFVEMGLLRKPYHYSFVSGVLGGAPATAKALELHRETMIELAPWEVIAITKDHFRLLATALTMGGNIRTGLEDHFYRADGTPASSNGELVEDAVALCRLIGREPATVQETQSLLGLPTR